MSMETFGSCQKVFDIWSCPKPSQRHLVHMSCKFHSPAKFEPRLTYLMLCAITSQANETRRVLLLTVKPYDQENMIVFFMYSFCKAKYK